MRNFKLFFTMLMLIAFNVGNVWAADVTYTFTSKSWTATSGGSAANWTSGQDGAGFSNNGIQVTTAASGANGTSPISFTNVTKVVCTYNTNASKGKGTIDVQVGTNAAKSVNWAYSGSASGTSANFTATVNYATAETGNVKITLNTSTNSIYLVSVTITTQSSNPEVNVSPASWDFGTVHASAEASKVFSVSGSNLTAGNLTLTVPDGFSVDPSSIAVDGTLAATNVTVSKNTSTEDDYAGNLSITGGGLASAKTVGLTMTVDADPAPTGTFKPFSGDIADGDYLIVADGAGMNTTVSSNRLQYTELTLTGENYVNPAPSVVWHVAASDAYWTIFNAEDGNYAAATGSNNQAQMLPSGTDNKSLWTITHSGATYTIQNKSNSRYLKKNGTYGFGCYADGTVSLYKLDDGTPNPPTFSPAGGSFLEAQSVTLSAEAGTTIYYTTDGENPTTSSSVYSAAIPVSTTTTIKAIAVKDDKSSSVASATYTITTPLSVDEIWNSITVDGPKDALVWGYVSSIPNPSYNNTYYISVDGSTEGNQLEIYKGDNVGNTVAVGDKVVVNGDLTIFNSIKEFASETGTIVQYTAKGDLTTVTVSGTPTKTAYTAADHTFAPAGLTVTATYASGYSAVVTEGITWGDNLTDHEVTASGTVNVTATVSGVTSPAYPVSVEFSAKTLLSIALSYDAVEVYQGLELPKPTVTATYSEGDPADVTAQAEFTGYNASTTGEQEITVSYTFGGETKNANYTVTVNPIYNVELAADVARDLIINVVGSAGSGANEMIVQGIVSQVYNPSNGKQSYWISVDGSTNKVEAYKGLYLGGGDFDNNNKLRVGDEVKVKGAVSYFNSSTPEFTEGNVLQSLARTPSFTIADVAELEVGAADMVVSALTIDKESEGAVTLASSDNTDVVTIVDGKLHAVAAGSATITANLAADGIYKAASTTFSVTVTAATIKYTVTIDGNGADGGTAPDAIADKAEGVSVTLPANSWTKTNKIFDGWKVINNSTSEEITVTAGAFNMPAANVTIQAQWIDPSVWALTYTSNVDITYVSYGSNDEVSIASTNYPAAKASTSGNNGKVKVTVPVGTHTLHFHAITWKSAADIEITASGVSNMSQSTFTLKADNGATGNSLYTLEGTPYMQYYSFTFDAVESETEILFEKTNGSEKRFVLYGVNQEGGTVPATITANPMSVSFGSVEQNASVTAKTINVTLQNVAAATVTLAEDDAFSIDQTSLTENGTITVTPNTTTVGTYATTVTISDDANAADAIVVNVSMTVTEPEVNDDVTGTWTLVTDAATLVAGKKVIIASIEDAGVVNTMAEQKSNNRGAKASTVVGTALTPTLGTKVFTLVDAGEGKLAFKGTNNKYLCAASSGSNHLKEQDTNDAEGQWIISIDGDAVATVTAQGEYTRNVMRFNPNSGNPLFACYASTSTTGTLVTLYMLEETTPPTSYTRDDDWMKPGELGTICISHGVASIDGANVYELAGKDASGNVVFASVAAMEPGKPYLFEATANKVEFFFSAEAEAGTAGKHKGMYGTFFATTITDDLDNTYYFAGHTLWSSSDLTSTGLSVPANRAYIKMDEVPTMDANPAPGKRYITLGVNGKNATTDLGNVQGDEVQSTKVLINGQLFILRGEKMYNANGQLVK